MAPPELVPEAPESPPVAALPSPTPPPPEPGLHAVVAALTPTVEARRSAAVRAAKWRGITPIYSTKVARAGSGGAELQSSTPDSDTWIRRTRHDPRRKNSRWTDDVRNVAHSCWAVGPRPHPPLLVCREPVCPRCRPKPRERGESGDMLCRMMRDERSLVASGLVVLLSACSAGQGQKGGGDSGGSSAGG